MLVIHWLSDNWIEVFGALAGILYVFLEIRQNILLWPVGIITSAVYIWVFLTGKLYADMGLQGYYLVISVFGWYWWVRGAGAQWHNGERHNGVTEKGCEGIKEGMGEAGRLAVTRLQLKTGLLLAMAFLMLYLVIWFVLDRLTDSPVPAADSFITSLSIIATWMLARKIYEHWYLWAVINSAAAILFFTRSLYATVLLYIIYCIMSFAGLRAWKKDMERARINNY